MEIYNWDCLEKMKDLETGSVDLLFCDLPYGQTACKWDCLIDLELFWKEVNRVCKINAPMFFTCSTKFGVSLINSNPKNFRYDLVWVKSAPTGFLNAKKMPMKKHEMVYVFYRKLPFYNIADNHTHKFLKETENKRKVKGKGCYTNGCNTETSNKYYPPLPTSVMKEPEMRNCEHYNGGEPLEQVYTSNERASSVYEPPLPNSVMKEPENKVVEPENEFVKGNNIYGNFSFYNNGEKGYDPPLPTSVMKEPENEEVKYGIMGRAEEPKNEVKEPENEVVHSKNKKNKDLYGASIEYKLQYETKKVTLYDPPLPNTILEVPSQKGKHATQKPTALMEWILKYYSRENDLVLDPTMGSGSTGVACQNMNRRFIGIEMDEKIFEDAKKRLINI